MSSFIGTIGSDFYSNPLSAYVPLSLRASHLLALPNTNNPLLLICAGTGIAPFIGLLQERFVFHSFVVLDCVRRHAKALGAALGPAVLYYGCRNRDKDFLFLLVIFLEFYADAQ